MASPILVAICAAIVLYRCYRYCFDRPPNFAPGPPKVPLLGSYPFLLLVNYKHLHRATEWLGKWYQTPVLGIHYAGNVPAMAVLDMATTKEVLNNPDLDGRPVFAMVRARDPMFNVWGIFFRDGPFWKDQRRFALRNMRDYGFGRRFEELEAHINGELLAFVDLVRNGPKYEYEREFVGSDGVVRLPAALNGYPGNMFLKVALNESFGREELECMFRAARAAMQFQRSGCMYGRLFSMMLSMKWLAPKLSGYADVRDSAIDLHEIFADIVRRQYESFEPGHQRSFVDLYFQEMHDGTENYSLIQITHIVVDFVFPALSAIGTSISFMLLRLLMNPACMERIQHDLDNICGRGRLPTLDDRVHLPYVEAALRESLRLDTLVANNVPHKALRDTKVGGFDLPQGGLVITVLQSAHTEEKVFRDALAYRPERFLSVNGQLNLKLDKSLPFGAGKRLCAGETFARNVLFLFVTALLQNFTLSVPEGERLPDPRFEEQTTGVVKTPPDFQLKFTSR